MTYEIIKIPESELIDQWISSVSLSDKFTQDDYYQIWEQVNASLKQALGRLWVEDHCGNADFAVGDDWDLHWTQCGGIYSGRICSPDYVKCIHEVLCASPYSEKWGYHTSVEVESHPDFMEFVIRKGMLVIPDDGLDYSMFLR